MSVVDEVEALLKSTVALAEIADSKYEYAVEDANGKQLAIEKRASKNEIRFYIEGYDALNGLSLSVSTIVDNFPATMARVHLKSSNLKGPYDGASGNSALRITAQTKTEFKKILAYYYGL